MAVAGNLLDKRIVRFVVVGGGAAGSYFVLSYLFVRAGLPPFVGSAIGYIIAFFCAYLAQRSWTFGGTHAHGDAFPRYLAAQLACAVLAGAVAHIAVFELGAPPSVMAALSTAVSSVASYVLSSRWVFAKRT
jgi:putative flippase GtrA